MYILKLMFEWRDGALWPLNDEARDRFGLGPLEDELPLSPELRRRIEELGDWHDQSLDWDYPPDPSRWSEEEFRRFDAAVAGLLDELLRELGPEFSVVYEPL